jgi:hypothetical protein
VHMVGTKYVVHRAHVGIEHMYIWRALGTLSVVGAEHMVCRHKCGWAWCPAPMAHGGHVLYISVGFLVGGHRYGVTIVTFLSQYAHCLTPGVTS